MSLSYPGSTEPHQPPPRAARVLTRCQNRYQRRQGCEMTHCIAFREPWITGLLGVFALSSSYKQCQMPRMISRSTLDNTFWIRDGSALHSSLRCAQQRMLPSLRVGNVHNGRQKSGAGPLLHTVTRGASMTQNFSDSQGLPWVQDSIENQNSLRFKDGA